MEFGNCLRNLVAGLTVDGHIKKKIRVVQTLFIEYHRQYITINQCEATVQVGYLSMHVPR